MFSCTLEIFTPLCWSLCSFVRLLESLSQLFSYLSVSLVWLGTEADVFQKDRQIDREAGRQASPRQSPSGSPSHHLQSSWALTTRLLRASPETSSLLLSLSGLWSWQFGYLHTMCSWCKINGVQNQSKQSSERTVRVQWGNHKNKEKSAQIQTFILMYLPLHAVCTCTVYIVDLFPNYQQPQTL